MRFITSLSVERQSSNPGPLWGTSARLVVIVSTCDNIAGSVIAYGIDPDTNATVFERLVPAPNLGSFLKIIVDGDQPPPSIGHGPIANSVDVTTVQPPPTGPKLGVVLTFADALGDSENVANQAA